MSSLWVAPHSIRWYPAGERCTDPVPGDVMLVEHADLFGKVISQGEKLSSHLGQPELKGFTWTDHTALIREQAGGPVVSEFGPKSGREIRPLESYDAKLYAVVNFQVSPDIRSQVLDADARLQGTKYSLLSYLGLIVDGFTGRRWGIQFSDAMFCSEAVTFACLNSYFTPDRPLSAIYPAHVAYWLGAIPPK